jgi:hypothetical protein
VLSLTRDARNAGWMVILTFCALNVILDIIYRKMELNALEMGRFKNILEGRKIIETFFFIENFLF